MVTGRCRFPDWSVLLTTTSVHTILGEGDSKTQISASFIPKRIFLIIPLFVLSKRLKCLEFLICGPLECNQREPDTSHSMLSLWTFIIKAETHFGCKSFLLPCLVHMSWFTFAWHPCCLHWSVHQDALIFQASLSPLSPSFSLGDWQFPTLNSHSSVISWKIEISLNAKIFFEYALQHGLKIIPKDCTKAFLEFLLLFSIKSIILWYDTSWLWCSFCWRTGNRRRLWLLHWHGVGFSEHLCLTP